MTLSRLFFFLFLFLFLFLVSFNYGSSQTLGGQSVYSFLKLPSSPLLSASGGVNVTHGADDVLSSLNNPAFLNQHVHGKAAASFNAYFAGIKAYQLGGAIQAEKWNTTFGMGVFFLDYGQIAETDAGGNRLGEFHPVDFMIQLSAGKKYLERWQYGITGKLIRSSYHSYGSTGLAFDVGIAYSDTANGLVISALAKNMGIQLTTYYGNRDELPFDLQIGVTKKLADAPFGFSATVQQLHHFNTGYHDTTFNNETGYESSHSFGTRLFNHFVFASHIYIGKYLEINLGYNRLRRYELNIGSSGNGLNGFSAGFRAQVRQFSIQYARAYFHRSAAYNQFAIGMELKSTGGIGPL